MQVTINVEGMSCQGCVNKVKKFVGELDGVSLVEVNLDKKSVSVEFSTPASEEQIKEAILDCGFEVR